MLPWGIFLIINEIVEREIEHKEKNGIWGATYIVFIDSLDPLDIHIDTY